MIEWLSRHAFDTSPRFKPYAGSMFYFILLRYSLPTSLIGDVVRTRAF